MNKSKNAENSASSPCQITKKIPTIDLINEENESVDDILNNAVIINQTNIDTESDLSTSKNLYLPHLKPIRPSIKEIKKQVNKSRMTQGLYDSYKWLEYSFIMNKLYCFTCRMFSPAHASSLINGIIINGNIYSKLSEHNCKPYHIDSLTKYQERLKIDQNGLNIKTKIDIGVAAEIALNRRNLIRIFQIVAFLGKQGLPFRGHFEEVEAKNHGNFLEMIEFRKNDIPEFKECLEVNRNNYLSKDSQNDMVTALANQHVRKFKPKSSFYAIIKYYKSKKNLFLLLLLLRS